MVLSLLANQAHEQFENGPSPPVAGLGWFDLETPAASRDRRPRERHCAGLRQEPPSFLSLPSTVFTRRRRLHLLLLAFLAFGACFLSVTATAADTAGIVAELINPRKLATLRARGTNPRIQKCVYWLATARNETPGPVALATEAVRRAGYTNALAAQLTRDALLRNLDIAEKLGCLDAEGLSELRKGNAATIRLGPYAGQELSVDHIIPRAVCVELDHVIANLELLPLRLNESKGDKIGTRQLTLAQTLQRAGLLSPASAQKVRSAQHSASTRAPVAVH